MVSDKIMELIAKLHALATNKGATEAEAANALAKMQELLRKYNLQIDDISISKEERKGTIHEDASRVSDAAKDPWINRPGFKGNRRWVVTLAGHVARYNFSGVMVDKRYFTVWFVGAPHNIEAVKAIWAFAVEQVSDLADRAYKLYRAQGGTVDHRIWKRNFSEGCVDRLGERLREDWLASQANTNVKALIVVTQDAITEYIEERTKGAKPRQSRGRSQWTGYNEGYSAGDLVSLSARRTQIGN